MTYVDPDQENNTFLGQHYRFMGPKELHATMDMFDRIYERRKDLKREAVHYRVTFEKKSFSPIGELRWWSVNGTPFGTAEHTYLLDALVHPFAIHYSWAIHDIVYTKRKKQKLWTKPFLSALLKGLGYELV